MNQQKGFSLIEVLVSLLLVTTLGLALLEQQVQSRQLITQLTLRAKASQFLDQVDESLFIGRDKVPISPIPYHFLLKKRKQSIILSLKWFKELGTIIRMHHSISALR